MNPAKPNILLLLISNKKNEFIFFDFLFWVALAIIFPTLSGHFSGFNIFHIFIYFAAVYFVGEITLSKIAVIREIPFLFKSGIYIIFGGIVCGSIFLFISSGLVMYAFSILFFIDLWLSKRVVLSFSYRNVVCLVPFFVMLFQTYELAYATTERFSRGDGDYYFYTAMVESIKTNHSLSNAVYHTGIPIHYMSAPFLAPAQLAQFSGISSQFSLWGVYGKIIPIICFGTISYCIVKLYEFLFGLSLAKNIFNRKQLLVSFMLLFLGPLHFLNLLKFNFKNTLFLGEGYVLPIGSPGFALSMFFAALVLLIVFSKAKYSLQEQLALIIFLCIITASKIALLLPLGILLGTVAVFGLFKKQMHLFFTLLIALPFCIVVYKLTIAAPDAVAVVEGTKNGYFIYFFEDLAGKYGISGGAAGKKVFLMMLITVFMWLSIKLLLFFISGVSLFKSNYKAVALLTAGIVSFFISMVPGFFINVYGRDGNGVFLFDGRFDMAQFVRAGIFLFSVIAMVFVLYLLYNHPLAVIRKGCLVLISFWMLVISFSFFSYGYEPPAANNQSWYKEVQQEFLKIKPGLMVIMGNGMYSGQTLTTAGVHPWYCTGLREDGEGIILSKTANL